MQLIKTSPTQETKDKIPVFLCRVIIQVHVTRTSPPLQEVHSRLASMCIPSSCVFVCVCVRVSECLYMVGACMHCIESSTTCKYVYTYRRSCLFDCLPASCFFTRYASCYPKSCVSVSGHDGGVHGHEQPSPRLLHLDACRQRQCFDCADPCCGVARPR